MMAVITRVRKMTTSHTFMIFCSNTPCVSLSEAACTKAAASPISVLSPVLFTLARHSPARTTNPDNKTRWLFLSGTLRGIDSPVSADVSTSISSPSTHSQSAGTTMPPLSNTMSPGTIWIEERCTSAREGESGIKRRRVVCITLEC